MRLSGLLIIILTVIGIVLYRRSRATKDKDRSFELGNVTVSSQGFDNPVYNTPLPFDDNFAIQYLPEQEQVHGFGNGMFSPGADSGVSVSGSPQKLPEKKYPPPGDAATVSEVSSNRSSKKSKAKKEPKPPVETSFENPNYEAGPLPAKSPLTSNKTVDSMVDVPLDDESVKNASIPSSPGTEGVVNPLFENGDSSPSKEGSIEPVPQVSVVHTQPSKKKKKFKAGKSEDGAAYKSFENEDETETIESFQNPLYDQAFYQPQDADDDPTGSPNTGDA